MNGFATITNLPRTAFKTKAAAEKIAATMPGEAFLIERRTASS